MNWIRTIVVEGQTLPVVGDIKKLVSVTRTSFWAHQHLRASRGETDLLYLQDEFECSSDEQIILHSKSSCR